MGVLPRLSAETPCEFEGVALPPNSWVLFGIAGANRDPNVFPDPNTFRIDRFRPDQAGDGPGESTAQRFDPLTFGRGPKSCPGLHLARKNMGVALETLVQRMPRLRLLDHDSAKPQGLAPRGPRALHVEIG